MITRTEPPSGAPSDVSLKVLDKHSALLSWSEPKTGGGSKSVTGYNVYLRTLEPGGKESNISTDGKTHQLTLNGLSPSATYEVAVSAFNSEGAGPSSASLILRTDPMGGLLSRRPQDKLSSFLGKEGSLRDPLRQPWFIVIIALTVMFILSSGVLIFLMKQRSGGKKPHVQHISLSLPKNDLTSASSPGCSSLVRDALWVDRSWFNGRSDHTASLHSHHHLQTHQMQQHHQGKTATTTSSSKVVGNWIPSGYEPRSPVDDSYSVIDGNNEYAEVAESSNLSTFKKRQNNLLQQHHQQQVMQQQQRPSTPGPYATTNLINITTNAMYRSVEDYDGRPPPPSHRDSSNCSFQTITGQGYAERVPFIEIRRSNASSPSPYKTRGCMD